MGIFSSLGLDLLLGGDHQHYLFCAYRVEDRPRFRLPLSLTLEDDLYGGGTPHSFLTLSTFFSFKIPVR
jgi:hypothetical protein